MEIDKMIDASLYNITVRKGNFDGEVLFEAKIKELPDVAEYADTHEEAYSLAIDAIETTAEALLEEGKTMPAPMIEENDYSGRVTLRMAKSMHAALASWSEIEETSLNQLMVNCLSLSLGKQYGVYNTMKTMNSPIAAQNTNTFINISVLTTSAPRTVQVKKQISLSDCHQEQQAYG